MLVSDQVIKDTIDKLKQISEDNTNIRKEFSLDDIKVIKSDKEMDAEDIITIKN
ncbi:MAG: hypothetical protein LBR28_07605 [Bacteroidales bacterium]|jgi:hypothetical protein|nr:hypothetical protein [Bacteroidales bacterium]